MSDADTSASTGPTVGPEYDDDVTEPGTTLLPAPLADLAGREFISALSLVFVRHGVTDLTASHILSGSSEPGPSLNAAGRVQAARAADAVYRVGRKTWDRVAPVTRVVASPMVRTQETAASIGRRLGVKVETDPRVREVDFGEWEGITAEAAAERDGDLIHHWQHADARAPRGESIPEVVARMKDFIAAMAHEHAQACREDDVPRSVAVTSHAVAIKSAVSAALEVSPTSAARMWPVPASLTIIQLRVSATGEVADGHLLCMGAPTE